MQKSRKTGLLAAITVFAVSAAAATTALAHGDKRGPRPEFSELDKNGDGKITAAEFAAHRTDRFAATDSNGDGSLSREELTAAAMARAKSDSERRIDHMIQQRDTDGDGQISLAELPGEDRAAHFFERLDADGDGAVSKAEMEHAQKLFRHGKKPRTDQ